MNDDRMSRPATRARSPRTVVLLGAVLVSLVGCSTDGRPATDSVAAIEEARAEAAAELAEVQAALDRQVEAADAKQAEAQAAAARKAAAERAASAKVATDKAAAEKTTAAVAAPRQAASARGVPATRPKQRTTGRSSQSTPQDFGTQKATTAPVAAPKPMAARVPPVTQVLKPLSPKPLAAAAKPASQPQVAVASTEDLEILVATEATATAAGGASVAAGCQHQDFQTGDRVLLTTDAALLVREAVLPACHREVPSAQGMDPAITSSHFRVTLPEITWREGDAWVLQIGSRRWPVTASTLSQYGWSIAVSAEGGVVAGPVDGRCGKQEPQEVHAQPVPLVAAGGTNPSSPPVSADSLSCPADSSSVTEGAPAAAP